MYTSLFSEICIEGTENLSLPKGKCKDCDVFIFTVNKTPDILHNKLECRVGEIELYCNKWESNPEQILKVYVKKDSSKGLNAKECWKLLREDMEKIGIEIKKLVMHK